LSSAIAVGRLQGIHHLASGTQRVILVGEGSKGQLSDIIEKLPTRQGQVFRRQKSTLIY
jgi:hypothetical protein